MGCATSKPSVIDHDGGDQLPRERGSSRKFSQYGDDGVSQSSLSRGDSQVSNRSESMKAFFIDTKTNGESMRKLRDDHMKEFLVNPEDVLVEYKVGKGDVPRVREAEQVAAGWPSWLVDAAGEAIKGWIPRRVDDFQKLDKIGQGTYSSVYKARDLLHDKIVALKRVRFDNLDPESVKFMAREIVILRRLDHPNIIKLEGLIVSPATASLYLIFEYMEHDLWGLASLPGLKFTEPQVKCYMMQLLRGLDHCHSNGVLHRDVKGANLLINNNGILKIADFGLATVCDSCQPLTSRVITLWYRPPELLFGAKHYGPSVDLWSAGCILGELYTGKPILRGRTEIEQLHRIFKLCGSPSEDFWVKLKLPPSEPFRKVPQRRRIAEKLKDIPASALGLLETLLSMDPESRGTAASAMKSEFFSTEPLACDPASLPKYPPSKEIDARMREEQESRHESKESKGNLIDLGRQRTKISPAALSAKSAAELALPVQMSRKKTRVDSFGRSETLYTHPEEPSSARGLNPHKNNEPVNDSSEEFIGPLHRNIGIHSGPLSETVWRNTGNRPVNPSLVPNRSRMGNPSDPATCRPSFLYANHGHSRNMSAEKISARFRGSVGELENLKDQDWLHHSHPALKETEGIKRVPQQRYEPQDERLNMSGPLFVPSTNVDQVLREHDRQLQEAARRARLDKSWRSKVHARERPAIATQLLLPRYRVK